MCASQKHGEPGGTANDRGEGDALASGRVTGRRGRREGEQNVGFMPFPVVGGWIESREA